jgi:hypothetical protein
MANQVTTTFRIDAAKAIASLNQYNTQLQKSVQLQKQLGGSATAVGGGARGGGGGGGGRGIGGALGGLGGIAGSLFGGLSVAAAAAFAKTAVDASNEASRANRALSASAVEAGKSYTELSKASADFARSAGISNAQAARSTAQLQRLVSLAGEGDQLERYQKGFLDLAAARGVAFEELDGLFSGIIAGTDDALNRFGKADPSKLAAQYAKELGKSVDQLTEQEKVLSRLKAFDTDFGLFNGANEARLQSFDGQLDQFNATIQNTIALFGDWIANSDIVGDNLEFISMILKNFSGPSGSQVRAMVAEGMTQSEIVAALGGGQGPTTFDYVKEGFSKFTPFGQLTAAYTGRYFDADEAATQRDVELGQKTAAQTASDELAAEAAREQQRANAQREFETARRALFQDRLNELTKTYSYEKELFQANLSIFEAERRSMLDGTMAAEMRYNREVSAARINTLKEESFMQNQLFERQIQLARFSGQDADAIKAQDEQRLFNLKQGVAIRLEEINAQQKQAELDEKRAEAIKQVTKDLRGQAIGFAGAQNPYVQIFSDAKTAAEDLIEKTKEFGQSFRDSIRQGIRERQGIALLSQDINNLRAATSLRREARELRFGIDPNQMSPEEAAEYRRQAVNEDLDAITRAFRRSDQDAAAKRVRDQAIIQATQGLSVNELDYSARSDAIGAREREATRLEQDRDKAREVFDRILSEFGSGGIPVKLAAGQSTITIIDESNGRAEVATRPTPASTRARY